MEQIKLFVFYKTDDSEEKYQYPFEIEGESVHYLNYTERSSAGGLSSKRYWVIDYYGQINKPDDIWWPEEDIISGNDIDKKAKRKLVEFILTKERF